VREDLAERGGDLLDNFGGGAALGAGAFRGVAVDLRGLVRDLNARVGDPCCGLWWLVAADLGDARGDDERRWWGRRRWSPVSNAAIAG
jgi:hypothetical protein